MNVEDDNTSLTTIKRGWWSEVLWITEWASVLDPKGKAVQRTWADFYERMAQAPELEHKRKGAGWSPSVFRGDHRTLENVVNTCALVLDVEPSKENDVEGSTAVQLYHAWSWTGHLLHSTHSHRLPGKTGIPRNCYRLILPLSRNVTKEEYRTLIRWAYRATKNAGLVIDESTSDASRLWYLPARRPGTALEKGTCWVELLLNPDSILETLQREEPTAAPPAYPRVQVESGENPAYVQAALDQAVKAILDAPEGGRNQLLNRQAFAIGGLVGSGALPAGEARDALLGATRAAAWKLPLKNEATFERAFKAGQQRPRTIPAPKRRSAYDVSTWELPTPDMQDDTSSPPSFEEGAYFSEEDFDEEGEEFDDATLEDEGPPAGGSGGGGSGGGGSGGGGSGGGGPVLPPQRPEVRLGPERVVILDLTLEHLGESRTVYQRSGDLVEPVTEWIATHDGQRDYATAYPKTIHPNRLEELLARSIDFLTWSKSKEDWTGTHPPKWLVDQIHKRGTWDTILPLRGIVESPVLRRNGTLLLEAGYDDSTGLIHRPKSLKSLDIPNNPTPEQTQEALATIFSLVKDFPFESQAHRSAWLAALLTPLCRPAFDGPAPLFLIDSNVRGAGKTKLVHLIGLITQGEVVEAMAYTSDDVEMEKRILSIAKIGDKLTFIDDIGGTFGTPSLNNALTSTRFRGRTLSKTEMVAYDLVTTWFATGNNVQLYRDMARRVCHVRLLCEDENPEYRELPDVLGMVRADRERYLVAALTLIRGWFAAGQPRTQVRQWGSFEGWSNLIRQIVIWCGEPDPGDVRDALAENADVEAIAHASLVSGWATLQERLNRPEGITVKEALDEIESHKSDEDLQEIQEAIQALCPAGGRTLGQQLGKKLVHLRERVTGNRCLTNGDSKRSKKGVLWTVQLAKKRAWRPEDSPQAPEPSPTS